MANDLALAVQALADALAARDEERVRSLSTRAGWMADGDGARRLFHQVTRMKAGLVSEEPARVLDGRGAVRVLLVRPNRPRPQLLWLLWRQEDGDWKVEAAIQDAQHAGLFVQGTVPALMTAHDLPPSDDGERWAAGVVAALRDDVLATADELAEVSGLPVLGAVPRWRESGSPAALPDEHPVVLALGELLAGIEERGRPSVLVLASTSPGEGKTTLAAGLAGLWAAQGVETLLVDADLRMPRQARRLGAPDAPGLAEVLKERASVDDAVHRTSQAHLDLLPAGRPPSDPSHLLDADALAAVLDAARADYPVVVVDAPPVLAFDDVLTLGALPEARVLLVAQPGRLGAGALRQALDKLRAAGIEPLGLVANRVISEVPPDVEPPDALREGARGEILAIDVAGTAEVPEVGRVAVGLRFVRPGEDRGRTQWTYLSRDPDTGALVPYANGTMLRVPRLLEGLAVDWDRFDTVAPAPRDGADPATPRASGDDAKDRLQEVMTRFTRKSGSGEGASEDASARALQEAIGQIARAIASGRAQAGTSSEEPGDDGTEGHRSETHARLERELQQVVTDFVQARQGGEGDEVRVDQAFLEEHTPELVAEVFQAFARSVVPDASDAPPPEKGARIDLSKLFAGLRRAAEEEE